MMAPRPASFLESFGSEAVSHWAALHGTREFVSGNGAIAYVEAAGSTIGIGSPFAAKEVHDQLREQLTNGRGAVYFGRELDEDEALPEDAYVVGEQPWWNTANWEANLRAHARLRYQVRRAAKRGVAFRELSRAELEPSNEMIRALQALVGNWLRRRHMVPMVFVARVAPFALIDRRRYFVAAMGDGAHAVGLLVATKIPARNAWVIDHVIRSPLAPNGTAEGLIDLAMRTLGAAQPCEVTTGLAPLFGRVPPVFAVARALSRPLYDFRGLYHFKAKLHPERWQRVLLEYGGKSALYGTLCALRAFAGGSLFVFGLRTLLHLAPALFLAAWGRATVAAKRRWRRARLR